ncbi:MAG: hypothetical protein ACFFD4_36220, partial [Candidatus Odinarchaeota archaeon]
MSKTYFILIVLASFYFVGLHYGANPVTGNIEATQTTISTWPGSYYYLEGQVASVEVNIWDTNAQPVETGELRLVDLNGSTSSTISVTGRSTLVSWTVTADGLTGIHIFEITFNDPNGYYSSCTAYQELLIGIVIGEGETPMAVDMIHPAFNVAKGQQAGMAGSLTSRNAVFPYFYIDQETAWISIEAYVEDSWKILAVTYPSTEITASYGFELAVVLPAWIITGPISARCAFSGSFETDLAATMVSFTINVLPAEKSLVLFSQQSEIERNNLTEQNVLLLDVQVPGFDSDPVILDLDLLTVDGLLVKQLITDQVLTGYSNQMSISISREVPVGDYNLSATLIDESTGVALATDSEPVTVVDDFLIDNFYWNISAEDALLGQQISGYLVSREEDTFTGIKSRLLVMSNDSGTVLYNNTTGENGYTDFSFALPMDLPAGYNTISFTLSPLLGDGYHRETSVSREIVIKKETAILHQEGLFLVRGQEGWFNATVIDEQGLPVATGSLSLELNGEMIYDSADPSTVHPYIPPVTVPRGINVFTWLYSGSSTFRESTESFPLAVYSVPNFNNLSMSSLETYPGKEICLSGELMEETGTGVGNAEIIITHRDNWGNTSLYSILTGEDGLFVFNYVFEDESQGTHSFKLEFRGWSGEYYLPVEGKPYFEVAVNPRVSLLVNNQLVAGETVTLEFQGNPSNEITVELLENGNWVELAVFDLDASGVHVYDWYIPSYLRGEVFLRTGYSDELEKVIFTLEVFVRPQLTIQVVDTQVLVGEEFEILVSCSESYDIVLDEQIWQNNLSSGSNLFTLVFNKSGDHVIKVISSGPYVVETAEQVSFQIRENYTVSVNIPARAQKAVDIIVKITVVDNKQQPLEGFSTELFINSTLMGTAITSQEGTASMTLNLNAGFYQGAVTIEPADSTVYVSKEIDLAGITVYSVPVIEISDLQPINGRTVNVEARLIDGKTPIINETIELYVRKVSGDTATFIGTDLTDDQGIAIVTWNVTQESGEYLLQIKNAGNKLLESVTVTKSVIVVESGPQILQASIVLQDSDKNLYTVTAIIEFP